MKQEEQALEGKLLKMLALQLEETLPELTGTPKQIAWAKDIRLKMFRRLQEEGFFDSWEQSWEQIYKGKVEVPSEAHWWIENNSCPKVMELFGWEYEPLSNLRFDEDYWYRW